MKRSLLIFGIVFLLMLSTAYAGVLEYYGKIIGTANVQPPVFYAHSEKESFAGKNYGIYKPNIPADGTVTEIKTTIGAPNGETMLDFSYPGFLLPSVNSFYPSTWTFYYRGKVNAEGAIVKFYSKVYKLKSDGTKTQIGTTSDSEPITPADDWKTVSSTFSFPQTNFASDERIMVEHYAKWSNASGEGYVYVKIDDPTQAILNQTRIEVSKA